MTIFHWVGAVGFLVTLGAAAALLTYPITRYVLSRRAAR